MVEYECGYAREVVAAPIAIMGFLAVASLLMLGYFLKHICFNKNKTEKQQKAAKITALGGIVLVFYFLALLLFFMSGIIDVYHCGYAYTRGIAYGFHFTGYNLLLVLFVYRFIKTFENSPYAISKTALSATKIIVCAPFVFVVFGVSSVYLNVFSLHVIAQIGLFYVATTFFASLFILIIFIKKLNVVIQDFVKQFGTISTTKLTEINETLR